MQDTKEHQPHDKGDKLSYKGSLVGKCNSLERLIMDQVEVGRK